MDIILKVIEVHKKQSVACLNCGLEFLADVYELKRGNGKFCSRKCQRSFQAKENAKAMKGPLTQKEMNRRWRESVVSDVIFAHHSVETALKNGTLEKKQCEVCGAKRVDAHHDDYSKPLDVRWLCRGHHLKFHRAT